VNRRSVLTDVVVNSKAVALEASLTEGGPLGGKLVISRRSKDGGSIRPEASGPLGIATQWALDLSPSRREALDTDGEISLLVPEVPRTQTRIVEGRNAPSTVMSCLPSVGELVAPVLRGHKRPAELLKYQEEGVEWLLGHPSGILADDMGLGKTIQAIVAMGELVRDGSIRQVMVVAPRTVLRVWVDELKKWDPWLTAMIITPPARVSEQVWKSALGRCHVLVTNYESLREVPTALTKYGVDLLVADEAHRIRNSESGVSQGISNISRVRTWVLTGTPVERDAEDLANLLSVVAPKRFSGMDASLPIGVLREKAKPYILRREKQQVLDELPDVHQKRIRLRLTPAQRREYELARLKMRLFQDQDEAIAMIGKLLAICDFAPKSGSSTKLEFAMELLSEAVNRGEKTVVFSHTLEPLSELSKMLRKAGGEFQPLELTGKLSPAQRARAVSEFVGNPKRLILLASIKAAGEGITLTEANHVVFLNRWWNPSTNLQARDRVVRIGQSNEVKVSELTTENTIEEMVDEILDRKGVLEASLVGGLAEREGLGSQISVDLAGALQAELQQKPGPQ
jgi:SNF2 family DNA or RNA helicase